MMKTIDVHCVCLETIYDEDNRCLLCVFLCVSGVGVSC